MNSSPACSFLMGVILVGVAQGCTDEGHMPDCPQIADYLAEGQEWDNDFRGSPEFQRWRRDSEEAGCLTPLGGDPEGDTGGAGGNP